MYFANSFFNQYARIKSSRFLKIVWSTKKDKTWRKNCSVKWTWNIRKRKFIAIHVSPAIPAKLHDRSNKKRVIVRLQSQLHDDIKYILDTCLEETITWLMLHTAFWILNFRLLIGNLIKESCQRCISDGSARSLMSYLIPDLPTTLD